MFTAITFAKTLEPHSRLYGEALSDVTGTVHVVNIDEDISQFVASTENVDKSLCLIETVYPVIVEPPSSGGAHVSTTSSGFHVVTGAEGCAGTYAAIIVTILEKVLKP
jgi:hypothetical protein